MSAWIQIPKPAESSVTTASYSGGDPIGLLLALTYSQVSTVSSITTGWTDITKPSVLAWTSVIKPSVFGWTSVNKPID